MRVFIYVRYHWCTGNRRWPNGEMSWLADKTTAESNWDLTAAGWTGIRHISVLDQVLGRADETRLSGNVRCYFGISEMGKWVRMTRPPTSHFSPAMIARTSIEAKRIGESVGIQCVKGVHLHGRHPRDNDMWCLLIWVTGKDSCSKAQFSLY